MVGGIRAGVNSGNYRHGANNSAGNRGFATEFRPRELPPFSSKRENVKITDGYRDTFNPRDLPGKTRS
ncbi:MAG: hypothetical protein ACRD41_13085, partial [Candidatus Acidiferrales bacterium]